MFNRVAVTGANGMLGSAVVAQLLECGYRDIVALVRSAASAEKLLANLRKRGCDQLMQSQELTECIKIVETQLNNPVEIAAAFEDVNTVYHCAATISFGDADPQELIQANVEITLHVVNAALQCGVRTFVHVSSIAALGEAASGTTLIDEGCSLESMANTSAYGISKFMCENQVKRAEIEGLHTIIVNPGVILSEGDWSSGGSASIIPVITSGLPVYTTGVVGYVDALDVARAMVLLSEHSDASGQRYILVSANLSMGELIGLAAKVVGRKAPWIRVGKTLMCVAWRADQLLSRLTGHKARLSKSMARTMLRKSYYNGDKIKKVCNFEYTPIEETLSRIVGAYIREKNG